MKNIIVGIDFLEHTDIIIEKAIEVGKAFNSKLWLLHVSAPDPDFVGFDVGPQFKRDERALDLKVERKKLAEYSKRVQSEGLEVDSLLIQGATIDTIIEESKKLNVNLIICGHHNHNFLYRLIFGATAKNIIMKSEIPVLIIPV
ncbi:MAG: universal stress protein [Marinilabiliaceae bacterium]|nr:universal stress protein [Marinilabiliaceae bacterium]